METYAALQSEVLRDPSSVKLWLQLASAAETAATTTNVVEQATTVSRAESAIVFERALRFHPQNYKLWKLHLDALFSTASRTFDAIPSYPALHGRLLRLFERALQALPEMPMLWERYLRYLMFPFESASTTAANNGVSLGFQPTHCQSRWHATVGSNLTRIRVEIFRALQALPFTQHETIWKLVRRWTLHDGSSKQYLIPMSVVHKLWSVMMQGNNSAFVQASYVQLLVERGERHRLLRFLLQVVDTMSTAPPVTGSSSSSSSLLFHGLVTRQRITEMIARPLAYDAVSLNPLTLTAAEKGNVPSFLKDPRLWTVVTAVLQENFSSSEGSNNNQQDEVITAKDLFALFRIGKTFTNNANSLRQAMSVALMRLGAFAEARQVLLDVMLSTADPNVFQDAFSIATQMETSLVDSVTLGNADAQNGNVRSTIWKGCPLLFNDAEESEEAVFSPLATLDQLIQLHPLLLNAALIRQRPHKAALWLKRVELLMDRASLTLGRADDDPRTVQELDAMFQQAFVAVRAGEGANDAIADMFSSNHKSQKSTPSLPAAETSVNLETDIFHLYCAYATIMWQLGQHRNTFTALRRGAFYHSFPTERNRKHAEEEGSEDTVYGCTSNVALFGRLVEYLVLSHRDDMQSVWSSLREIIETELKGARLITNPETTMAASTAAAVVSNTAVVTLSAATTTKEHQLALRNQGVDPNLVAAANGSSDSGAVIVASSKRAKRMLASSMFQGGGAAESSSTVAATAEGNDGATASESSHKNSAYFQRTTSTAARVLQSATVWSLIFDVALAASGPTGPALDQVVAWMKALGLMTADVVCRYGALLYNSKETAELGSTLFEEALDKTTDACARLLLSETYGALFFQHSMNQTRSSGSTRFTRLERLREILDVGVAAICASHLPASTLPDTSPQRRFSPFVLDPDHCYRFLLSYARVEEMYGLVTRALGFLRTATLLAHQSVAKARRTEFADGENNNSSALTASEGQYLSVLDVLLHRTLQARGSELFAEEMTEQLKRSHRPCVVAELVLRFTGEQQRCGETVRARAIFDALAPTQNPELPHGAKYWAAWSEMEVKSGSQESFMFVQRKKRNTVATFSKSEVIFEQ